MFTRSLAFYAILIFAKIATPIMKTNSLTLY